MDMWSHYRDVVKLLFPNATIVVDKFHYVRQIYWAFNKVRINIQKDIYHTDRKTYNLIKSNWKLLIKYSKRIKKRRAFYSLRHRKYITAFDIIDECIQSSDLLATAYSLKEEFYDILNNSTINNIEQNLDNYIFKLIELRIPEFKEVISAFTNWKQEIINSFIPNNYIVKNNKPGTFTNGYIEGVNNFIKVIKRIAFGYRNYDNFRTRILYIHNNKTA